ncbi:GTPase Der [Plasmodiophora brassicae]|uniref:GTPase Der n=1 Tax=Plasmodiophora brassicae TaxID=37360 RepID=A0A0G4IJ28_PLABS|nr:hypothetical protein PBRA_009619 [Plasmodiophora brassicae]SPR01154.1 unnamed protein product [Plasmodiophora brassicae]
MLRVVAWCTSQPLRWFATATALPRVAIIGRPNTGKSTFFNRLTNRRLALTDEAPGMTRDRLEYPVSLFDLRFTLIDTPGLEDASPASLERDMMVQSQLAAEQADVVIFLVDGREGITSVDEHFARWLRRHLKNHHGHTTRVICVANKCEGHLPEENLVEASRLGFGEPVPFSAMHGEGRIGLFNAMKDALEGIEIPAVDAEQAAQEGDRLRLAIVGRPNVGKSTLVNALVGDPTRCLTGPTAGITRDSIVTQISFQGREIDLVDTAGITGVTPMSFSKHSKQDARGMNQSLRAVRFANVVALLLDATSLASDEGIKFPRKEVAIARHVTENGRCLTVVANKWDQIPAGERKRFLRDIRASFGAEVPQAAGVQIVPISALNRDHIDSVLSTAVHSFDRWNSRTGTGLLNRWLSEFLRGSTLPLGKGGKRMRIRYITQVKTRPPTFCVFGTRGLEKAEAFLREMAYAIQQEFDLDGVPVRIHCRAPDNPYVDENGKPRPKQASASPSSA